MNRRNLLKGILATPLAPAALYAADNADNRDVYDSAGNPLYIPCKTCPELQDDLIAYGAFGVVTIGAQSLEPMCIVAHAEYVSTTWDNECPTCKMMYPLNNGTNVFDAHGDVGAINALPGGMKLCVATCDSATVTIYEGIRNNQYTGLAQTVPPTRGAILREFKPDFSEGFMELYI